MDSKEKNRQYSEEVEKGAIAAMSDPKYWARRRSKWDEWGSPVGLSLGWAIFVISSAFVIYLLHNSGLI
jgi:hypothetical protein